MRASARRSCTRTSRASASARCTLGHIRGPREGQVARYADKLLSDGERIALRGRQHFLATVIEGRVAWAIFVAALVLVLLTLQLEQNIVRDIFGWLGLILLLIGL